MQWNAPLESLHLGAWHFFYPSSPTRSCTGKMTPSLTLLAKCAYLETTRWLISQGWKQIRRTTCLWLLSIRLALGHSPCPSTAPQRNHVSPSPDGHWKYLYMVTFSLALDCPHHAGCCICSALLLVLRLFLFPNRSSPNCVTPATNPGSRL